MKKIVILNYKTSEVSVFPIESSIYDYEEYIKKHIWKNLDEISYMVSDKITLNVDI